MREIKFRAWQDGKMLYSSGSGVYHTQDFLNRLYEDCNLMQFTGLLDKNGKEIYEGDIVDHIATQGAVIFEDGMFSLNMSANVQFGKYKQPLCCLDVLQCEVTGNIYNNPELLKS